MKNSIKEQPVFAQLMDHITSYNDGYRPDEDTIAADIISTCEIGRVDIAKNPAGAISFAWNIWETK